MRQVTTEEVLGYFVSCHKRPTQDITSITLTLTPYCQISLDHMKGPQLYRNVATLHLSLR